MRVLVQRVKDARVSVGGQLRSEIGMGFLLLVGLHKEDDSSDLEWMANKVVNLRIFNDEEGKMNLNLAQAHGEMLSVPQFTLTADLQRGNRPGFEESAKPEGAKTLWRTFNQILREKGAVVKEGEFGASMEVALTNDGPVTFLLDSKTKKSTITV